MMYGEKCLLRGAVSMDHYLTEQKASACTYVWPRLSHKLIRITVLLHPGINQTESVYQQSEFPFLKTNFYRPDTITKVRFEYIHDVTKHGFQPLSQNSD
jgi:hypothetical protein